MGAALTVDPRWWASFFDEDWLLIARQAPPERAAQMVDFAVEQLGLDEGTRVLDLACGHGRHSLELARRGIPVVGLDHSEPALALARAAALSEELAAEFVRGDMRDLPFGDGEFAAVINLFTSFGYFEDELDDERVLGEVARLLGPTGRFLLDTINAPWLFRNFRERMWRELEDEAVLLEEHSYDLVAGRNEARWTLIRPDGTRGELAHSLRIYTAPELVAMLSRAGLVHTATYGDFEAGECTPETHRLILVAAKEATTPVE